jgi:hypothetical protein
MATSGVFTSMSKRTASLILLGALLTALPVQPGVADSGTFKLVAVGACKLLSSERHGLVLSGSLEKPKLYAVGKCPKQIPGYEKYSKTVFTSYSINDLIFTGYSKNGSRTVIYYKPAVGKSSLSPFVVRTIKPPK